VKSAFTIISSPTLNTDSSRYLFYSAGSVTILKLGEFTFSLMGRKQCFINLTGCSSMSKIGDAVSMFKDASKIGKISNLKINSITFTMKIGVEDSHFKMLRNIKPRHFTVKKFPKFSAICFKHEKMKISGNYFHKSRLMVCMGAHSVSDIYHFTTDLKLIGFI
jgi:hypothetical protein